MDFAELQSSARIACQRWWNDRDHDDLYQIALIYGWLNPDLPQPLLTYAMRMRCVDYLRIRDGRTVDKRTLPLSVNIAAASIKDPGLPPSVSYGIEGRDGVIIDLLHAGFKKVEIADAFGFHPSRVSQRLREIRKNLHLS